MSKPFRSKVGVILAKWRSDSFKIKHGSSTSAEICKAIIQHDDFLEQVDRMNEGKDRLVLPDLLANPIPYIRFDNLLDRKKLTREEVDRLYMNAIGIIEMLESQGLIGRDFHSRAQMR